MRFWTEGGFFSSVKGHVFKWWQLIIQPIRRINNNRVDYRANVNTQQVNPSVTQIPAANTYTETQMAKQQEQPKKAEEEKSQNATVSQPVQKETNEEMISKNDIMANEDPLEVLKRINEEKEAKRRKEIEVARKLAEEQQRINAIMNANKVDVNAFIAAGKAAKQEIAENKEKQQQEENLRRAQEIMDRLNREAEADEYMKQAEIEAAKQEAKKQFGN